MVIITQLICINLSQGQAKCSRILSAVGKNSEMLSKQGLFLNFKYIHQVQYCWVQWSLYFKCKLDQFALKIYYLIQRQHRGKVKYRSMSNSCIWKYKNVEEMVAWEKVWLLMKIIWNMGLSSV